MFLCEDLRREGERGRKGEGEKGRRGEEEQSDEIPRRLEPKTPD
ncbi:MAG: hypothetical protein R6W81_13625 [Bacteroidales bacterium]